MFARFQTNRLSLLVKLKQFDYAKKNAAIKKSFVKYVQNVLVIISQIKYSLTDGFQYFYDFFYVNLKVNLIKQFFEITDIKFYIQHFRDVQLMWFEIYQNFNVRFPNRYQPMGYQQRHPFPRLMKTLPVPLTHFGITNKPNAYIVETKSDPITTVYFTDFAGQNYEYDDVVDVYMVVEIPQPFHQPPGHIPRRWRNTHDGGEKTGWENAGGQHRCNEQNCTHYH